MHSNEIKAAEIEIEVISMDALKKFNKDKKQIKKWAKKYSLLLATDTLIKKIPVVLGPVLNRIGMFPQPVTHNEPIGKKIDDVKGSIKCNLRRLPASTSPPVTRPWMMMLSDKTLSCHSTSSPPSLRSNGTTSRPSILRPPWVRLSRSSDRCRFLIDEKP